MDKEELKNRIIKVTATLSMITKENVSLNTLHTLMELAEPFLRDRAPDTYLDVFYEAIVTPAVFEEVCIKHLSEKEQEELYRLYQHMHDDVLENLID